MSESRRLQFTPDLEICRILNGMWQVSGAHGSIAPQKAISSMFSYLDAGFTTWDLADHYGPAEDFRLFVTLYAKSTDKMPRQHTSNPKIPKVSKAIGSPFY